jgi:hypothetical protein
MTQQKFADFEPQTMLSDSDFDVFESKGRVRLSPEHRAAVERELKEYEFLRFLEERGVGTAHKKALLKLEATTEKFIESIEAVTKQAGSHLGIPPSGKRGGGFWPSIASDQVQGVE